MNRIQDRKFLRKRDRLSVKQTKWTLFTAFVLGMLFSFAQLATDFNEETNRLHKTSRELIQVLDQPASFAAFNKDKKLARELIVGYFSYHPTYKAIISDIDGNVLASSTSELAHGPYRFLVDKLFGQAQKFEQKLFFQPQPSNVLDMANIKEVGKLEVWIDSYPAGKIFFERATRILIYGLLRNFVLAVVLLFIFHHFVTRPFNNLVGQLEQINPQVDTKSSIAIPDGHQKDEFALLGTRMNQMLEKIDHHIETQMQQAREIEEANIALFDAKVEAEAANEAKSNFLSIMSHELRTPMNGILGVARVLLLEEIDENQKELVQMVLKSGEGLNVILTEIATLTQLDSKGIVSEKNPFSLKQLEELLATLFLSEARVKKLELISEFDPKIAQTLVGDTVLLQQLLSNLIANAFKFTKEGQIKLIFSLVEEGPTSQTIKIQVIDTGIGISPDKQQLIWDIFTQADESSTRAYGGIGLGLPIVKRLSDLMGGQLELVSERGKGSTVTLTLALDFPTEMQARSLEA